MRGGNIKRVASAVGEGSIAVAFVHQVLQMHVSQSRCHPPSRCNASVRDMKRSTVDGDRMRLNNVDFKADGIQWSAQKLVRHKDLRATRIYF